ncbi:MAG: SUMF1/EgtB/PvdO family nonheme iron enzyme [Polyangiaceae bacterium]|nr:SUMF1/EgtB/PvdO family nonheme iron enzyme [Polyangiaceae bacterium]MCW5791434.1 SUMF1/EgtB/PvdO family nonheme iron enzyme [Polyangiaceae bacterium]
MKWGGWAVLGVAMVSGGLWLVASAEAPAGQAEPIAAAPESLMAAAEPATEGAEAAPEQALEPAPPEAPLSAPNPAAASPSADGSCPDEMVLVDGDYCTDVRHTCREWLDDPKLPYARCKVYEPVAKCVGKRVALKYCIDRHEYTAPGDELPLNHQSFMSGAKLCKAQGKRLCSEQEWNFACEGEEMRPYPYGWERKPVCNQDQEDLYTMVKGRQQLKDRRKPAGELAECVSPFGVHDLAGNLDEPTLREGATHNYPFRTALKGGWWMAARNRCRPATTAHDDHYEGIQVGVRCCADLPGEDQSPNG